MATYDVSTVASQIQPPQPTSLGDMLNIARGAQAYQQAQQVNPLIAQQQQTATEQAQFNLQQVKVDKVKGLANSLLASQNWSDPSKMDHEFEFVERVAKSQGLDVTSPNNPLELIKKEYKDQGPEAAYQKLYQMTYGAQPQGTQFEAASRGVVAPPLPGKQQPVSQTAAEVPEYSQPIKPAYQPPIPGQVRPQLPSEEADRSFGEKYRLGLKAQQNNYATQKQNIDNLYDKVNSMIGGNIFQDTAVGTALRKLQIASGSPDYQELEKMLARVQLSQMSQADQANTDMGRQMNAVANGQAHLDPKVILEITRQNAANMERFNSQTNAAEIAGSKLGDANLTRKFATEWNKNSDNKIFEMKYIFNHAKSPEEGAKAVREYLQSQPASKRKELAEKYLNLQKLEKEGTL
jgi:hypothetical protein